MDSIAKVNQKLRFCLYIASNLSKIRIERLFIATIPYLMSSSIVLGLITFVPQLVMFLPNLLMK
jgi:TRAP-type C4-dicarboxylate transport system permease large subunit